MPPHCLAPLISLSAPCLLLAPPPLARARAHARTHAHAHAHAHAHRGQNLGDAARPVLEAGLAHVRFSALRVYIHSLSHAHTIQACLAA